MAGLAEKMVEQSDDELLALYAAGDQSAARLLTMRHTPRVLAMARRILLDAAEAEDVTQDAMMRVWKIAPDWRAGEAKLSTWLYRVTANLCTDRLRKRRWSPLEDAPEQVDPDPGVERRMVGAERASALREALKELPDRQRMAVTLRFLEEKSNPEIAEIMDATVDAVESLTARGKRALAKALGPRRNQLGLD